MVAVKETRSPVADNGLYILARPNHCVRALIDSNIGATMPRLHRAVEVIGHILEQCLDDEGMAVTMKFERGPRSPAA